VRENEVKPIDHAIFDQQFSTSRLLNGRGGSQSWMGI
jgi:hypothetical protein